MGFVADKPAGRFVADSSQAPKAGAVTGTPPLTGFGVADAPVEVPRAVVQNMGANAASGLAGLAGAALPGPEGQGADFARRTQQALSYEPQGRAAQAALKVLGLPGEAVEWVRHKLGGKAADRFGPLAGAATETAVEAVPMALGGMAARAKPKPLTAAQQRVAEARDQGFTMTPEEMGAGVIPRTAASLAGEPRLAKLTSKKNADVALAKAKEELRIKPDAPLDLDTLALIRKQEGKAYEGARKIGQVTLGKQYLADIDALGAKYQSAAKEFPGLTKADVEQAVAALKKEDPAIAMARAQGIKLPPSLAKPVTVNASGMIDTIDLLRKEADEAFRNNNSGLAKVKRGGADALEAELERHVIATGQQDLIKDFRAARKRIAKTYAVEKALLGDDRVSLPKLGAQVTARKPLTGGLKESGEFARDFDRSSQKPTSMPTGATMHDLALSLWNAMRTGGGSLAADVLTAGARPAARYGLASRPAQWAMDPRTNLSGPALEAIGASTALPDQQPRR